MNIFYVDEDPAIAAQSLVDKHVVKMILESAQLLSTAHRVLDGYPVEGVRVNIETGKARKVTAWKIDDERDSLIYSATHINHPSAIWCRNSVENYNWLVDHLFALMQEYTFRYEKVHKCFGDLSYTLQSPPHKLKEWDWTTMPSCMDEIYRISDSPIDNYRNYYNVGKANLHKWTKRNPPEWIINKEIKNA
jgi:hypothetical protein